MLTAVLDPSTSPSSSDTSLQDRFPYVQTVRSGTGGACEYVIDMLKKYVFTTGSEDEVAKIAEMTSYTTGNLCQMRSLDNKNRMRSLNARDLFRVWFATILLIRIEKLKKMQPRQLTS